MVCPRSCNSIIYILTYVTECYVVEPPTRNESTDSFTSSMVHSCSLISSSGYSSSHNVPATLLPSIHERFSTAVDFSQQFVDGKFCCVVFNIDWSNSNVLLIVYQSSASGVVEICCQLCMWESATLYLLSWTKYAGYIDTTLL